MSPDDHKQTIERIQQLKVGAIIRTNDAALARDAIQAAINGGIRMVEFTLNTPGALDSIARFAANDQLLVGAGTVMSPEQVREAISAGARFIVSPNFDPKVVAETRQANAVSIPGTFTPSEMVVAHEARADFVKLFPAPADIASYVRQIVGPLPMLRIFPTAGVGPENFIDVLDAGAAGVGFVSSLFTPDDMASRDFASIERRARAIQDRLSRSSHIR